MVSRKKDGGSKLTMRKEWVDLPEAARYLSVIFDEEVGEADALKLVLEGELKLSVNISPTVAKRRIVSSASVENSCGVMERLYSLGENLHHLQGVYDLPMVGLERKIVNSRWQQLSGGPAEEYSKTVDGVVVEKDGKQYILQKLNFNVPPTDSVNGQLVEDQNSSEVSSSPPLFCNVPKGKLKTNTLEKPFLNV